MEDRWQEALSAAEMSWELSPGTPYAARSLTGSLLNLRQVRAAAERTAAAADNTESNEILHLACWYLCAFAETQNGKDRTRTLRRATELADKILDLAPLADRDTRSSVARTRLDIAQLADDHAAMEQWADEARSPFHRKVLENIRKHPEGVRIRLPFRNAVQKYNECLPTSLGSAMAAMGTRIDADAMAAEITFGGTQEWAAGEWLQKLGFEVRFFVASPEISVALIKHGFAFVVTLEYDSSAHAVAVVGLDEAAGTILVHDPQGFRENEYLIGALGREESPLGPRAMIAVLPERAALLDQLLPKDDCETMAAREARRRAQFLHGPSGARKVVADLAIRYPAHPNTRLVQALQLHEDGRIGEALTQFQRLLKEFPNSSFIRANLLACCRSLGNTATMREILANVVDRKILPGVDSQQNWMYAPSNYVAEYADLLSVSAQTRNTARKLLLSLLQRNRSCGPAWHVLADLLWSERDYEGAILGYRIATSLEDHSEHYARAYCSALRHAGREEEGLDWLARRVKRFGDSTHGVATWITWIDAFEEGGHPERALTISGDALEKHGNAPELMAFLIPFFARMGRWQDAEDALNRLRQEGNEAHFHEASASYYRMRGELGRAIEHCEAWLRETPLSMRPRYQLVDLIAKRDKPSAAAKLAREWLAERPGHDELETLYCQQLRRISYSSWRKYSLLRRRVKRNREDGWAWRELALSAIYDFELGGSALQKRLERRIVCFLQECDRTAPEATATLRTHVRWMEARGEWPAAVERWLEIIEQEPDDIYSYRRAWDCSTRLNASERWAMWTQMESILLRQPGHSAVARELLSMAGRRFGVVAAEQAACRWLESRKNDPEVMEGYVDLLLDHGHGRSDYQRALDLLLPALQRFPFQVGLRFSHANALQKLNKFQEAEEVLDEIIRRHPDDSNARIRRAWVTHHHGETQQALNSLVSAAAQDPQNSGLHRAQVEILADAGRLQEAKETITKTTLLFPDDVGWREHAIRLLRECGVDEAAVETARGGVVEYPRGAYLWMLLGKTLYELNRFATPGEIESCFRRSLAFNEQFFEAADYLCMLLADQRRYAEAEAVLLQMKERLDDASPVRGRRAWIRRSQGHKHEALEEMIAVVRSAPWYTWGWTVLLDWIVEDKSWPDAKNLLLQAPPELHTNTRLRQKRLDVLHKAGVASEILDQEWDSLLRDFPEDLALHLRRYDSLHESNRWKEAAAVLEKIRSEYEDNPYWLARWIEVLANAQRKEEAIGAMMQVFFAETEPSTWPPGYGWEAIKGAGYAKDAYQSALRRLQQGGRPTEHSVAILAAFAMENGGSIKRTLQPFFRTLFPDSGARDAMKLLKAIEPHSHGAQGSRGKILRELADFGYQRLVVRYWRTHKEAVESEIGAWSETVRAQTALKNRRATARLMSGWQSRNGVAMWTVANYVKCCFGLGPKRLKEIRSSCRDALAGLPHDHCARYLVYIEAEACALLRDEPGFLEIWRRYREYFDGKLEDNEWFDSKRRYLLADIPVMARILEGGDRRLFRKKIWGLRWERISSNLQTSFSFSNSKISPRWWWILIWILIQLIRVSMENR